MFHENGARVEETQAAVSPERCLALNAAILSATDAGDPEARKGIKDDANSMPHGPVANIESTKSVASEPTLLLGSMRVT
jgi:hypothetical protein